MYLRLERVDELLQALKAMQHNMELSRDRIDLCEERLSALTKSVQDTAAIEAELTALKASVAGDFSLLRNVLQRFSLGSPAMIPRELAEAIAYRGDDANALYRAFVGTERAMCSPPAPIPLSSTLCHQHYFLLDQYRFWAAAMKDRPKFSRKQWEWFYIAQALFERDLLRPGKRGIGFGVGCEPLPALFASYGAEIIVTDQSIEAAVAGGWVASRQHSHDLSALNDRAICGEAAFLQLVGFMPVDMNNIPASLDGRFDFCWSSCALEHLGSLQHGLSFIGNSLRLLKPGGIAVHTTEFNLSSNTHTIETPSLSIYRRRDIDKLMTRLQASGSVVAPIDWEQGEGFAEIVVDLPPFGRGEPHIRLRAQDYDVTSVGIIIQK